MGFAFRWLLCLGYAVFELEPVQSMLFQKARESAEGCRTNEIRRQRLAGWLAGLAGRRENRPADNLGIKGTWAGLLLQLQVQREASARSRGHGAPTAGVLAAIHEKHRG